MSTERNPLRAMLDSWRKAEADRLRSLANLIRRHADEQPSEDLAYEFIGRLETAATTIALPLALTPVLSEEEKELVATWLFDQLEELRLYADDVGEQWPGLIPALNKLMEQLKPQRRRIRSESKTCPECAAGLDGHVNEIRRNNSTEIRCASCDAIVGSFRRE